MIEWNLILDLYIKCSNKNFLRLLWLIIWISNDILSVFFSNFINLFIDDMKSVVFYWKTIEDTNDRTHGLGVLCVCIVRSFVFRITTHKKMLGFSSKLIQQNYYRRRIKALPIRRLVNYYCNRIDNKNDL